MSRSSTTRDRADRPRGPAARPAAPRTTAPVGPGPARRRPGASRRRRSLGWLVGLLALGGLAVFLWAGPLLSVRSVRVDGVVTLPAALVQEEAGVAAGTPLLQVDVDAAAARVGRLPQVADVQVTRGWPSSVVITVVERVPLAVVEDGGRRTLVDAEGVLFDTITGDPPDGVVRLEVGDPGAGDPATDAGLSAIAALPPEVRAGLETVTVRGGGADVRLRLRDGTAVLWGDGDEARRKATVLVALLQQIEAGAVDPAETLDVSAPGAVVLR